MRRRVEAAARMAREQASLTLLRELEEEETAGCNIKVTHARLRLMSLIVPRCVTPDDE